MPAISLKSVLRKCLWFLNVGFVFKRRARSRTCRDRIFFIFEGRKYTYSETYKEAVRYANLFLAVQEERIASGRLKPGEKLSVGIYQENTPEFVFAFFGAAINGSTLFGINTGFRGETLTNVINQAEIGLLFTDQTTREEVDRILANITVISQHDIITVGGDNRSEEGNRRGIPEIMIHYQVSEREISRPGIDSFGPLVVIYTSGTTGAPKGVACSHLKCLGAGLITRRRIGLTKKDRGYISMPLFHSNSVLLGIMPLVDVGGSFLLKRKFSASAFEKDILENGVTYMNYVGQPVHYILSALEKKYNSAEAIENTLAKHPLNLFRIAHGNGASVVDRKKLIRYLGMEHVYELYGSTEAPITTVLMPGEPMDSVGRVSSKKIVILDANDQSCPPGIVDDNDRLVNYEEAVGEIARRIGEDNIFFDGYFKNNQATNKKYRNGYYCSGDLGHIRIVDGRRYLFFNGRTDDWIRKDGENFSAENVTKYAESMPGTELAVAYGAPCSVSDEKVMVAIKLTPNMSFDPQATFEWFMELQKNGGMDPKWMPDYIRIVEDFPMTRTHKLLIRPLKRSHFNMEKYPEMMIYYRRRGDTTYHLFTRETYLGTRQNFEKNGRTQLLDVV